jgi:hypothetical protein
LHRKALIESHFPSSLILTTAGADYDTGIRDKILHGADH